jgi:Fe-S oxidoreductase
MALNKVRENIYHCFRCGYCKSMVRPLTGTYGVCPIVDELKFEHYSPRGKVALARGLLEGILEYDEKLIDVLYACLGCGACKEVCPLEDWAKVDVPLIVRSLHQDIIAKGYEIPGYLKQSLLNLERERNPLGHKTGGRLNWSHGLNLPFKGKTAIFVGCDFSYEQPDTAQKLVGILRKAGVDYAFIKSEVCCGYPALWIGDSKLARKLTIENVDAIEKTEAEEVVTLCPSCYVTLKFDYPELLGKDLSFEVLHITQVLSKLVDEGKLKLRPDTRKVTFHDPCQLSRQGGRPYELRKILKNIPDIELVQPLRNGANTWCCGGGGLVPLILPKISLKIASDRVNELVNTGSNTIITACPYCSKMLNLGAKRLKTDVEIHYVTDYLSELL